MPGLSLENFLLAPQKNSTLINKAHRALLRNVELFSKKFFFFEREPRQRPLPVPSIQNVGGPQVGVIYCKILPRVLIGTPNDLDAASTWARCPGPLVRYLVYFHTTLRYPRQEWPSSTLDCEGPRRRAPTLDTGIRISGKFPIQ
eukprot:SAG31_NODE_1115_length_9839_cov_39.294661_2_plen_144_part_00